MADSFPRQQARTQRFTLGAPRNVTVAPDGSRVAFLRAAGPGGRRDLAVGARRRRRRPSGWSPTRRRCWPPTLGDLPPEERVRRERARESAAGITGYATDAAPPGRRPPPSPASWSSPTSSTGTAALVPVPSAVIDPRPDPTGTRVAWVDGRQLWVAELDDPSSARVLAGEDDPEVRWGVAEFAAAEEMDRYRGLLVGARRLGRCSPPGWTTRPCSAGGSPTRPTRTGRRPRSPTRRPARRTPTSPPGSSGSTAPAPR